MKKSVAASEKPVKAKEFDKELFKRSVEYNVRTLYRKNLEEADAQQIFQAVSYAIKDRIVENWMETQKAYEKEDPKMVYYMSMEFLMGRALGNNLINLKAYKPVAEALEELGLDLNLIEDQEPDAALGNGGLGRLAACFLDSLATLGYPAYGCGIRYRYGMFKQEIRDGYQVEVPDNWLMNGNPFELRRPEYAKIVKFGGYVSVHTGNHDALLDAADFVAAFQKRQGLYISCIEEIAFKRGFIDKEQLLALAEPLLKTNYGKYLVEVANGL